MPPGTAEGYLAVSRAAIARATIISTQPMREDQWDDGWHFAAGEVVRDAMSEPEKPQRPISER